MKNEFKGTKGKWSVGRNSQGYNSFHINSKYLIISKNEELANMRLISKAPEMLEMLIKCENTLREVYECDTKDIQNLIKSATEI